MARRSHWTGSFRYEVATIGFGPQGGLALERLLTHARDLPENAQLTITVLDPRPTAGDGAEYDRLRKPLSQLPPQVSVSFERARVRRLHAVGRRWKIEAVAGGPPQRFDQILLLDGAAPADSPSGTAQAAERVTPGSVVAARGFGRAFVDLALTLTEGRGGSFAPVEGGELRYLPSGAEPAVLLPYSRSGAPPVAQPDAGAIAVDEEAIEAARERIESSPGRISLQRVLLPALAEASGRLLAEVNDGAAARAAAMLAGASSAAEDPRVALDRTVRIASGEAAPDEVWAVGETWRRLQATIARRCSGDGVRADERATFIRLATSLERLAFGPPVEALRKLCALDDAGFVDLGHVRGGLLTELPGGGLALRSSAAEIRVEHAIDAIAPPLGARHLSGGPVAELLARGYARIPVDCRGLQIADDARCIGAAGKPTVGLSALGGLTEDWVVGSCSLDPSVHPHADRWARGVIGRARAIAQMKRREAPVDAAPHRGIDRTATG